MKRCRPSFDNISVWLDAIFRPFRFLSCSLAGICTKKQEEPRWWCVGASVSQSVGPSVRPMGNRCSHRAWEAGCQLFLLVIHRLGSSGRGKGTKAELRGPTKTKTRRIPTARKPKLPRKVGFPWGRVNPGFWARGQGFLTPGGPGLKIKSFGPLGNSLIFRGRGG